MTAENIATSQIGTHSALTGSPIANHMVNAAELATPEMRAHRAAHPHRSAVHTFKQMPYRFAPDMDYLPVDVFVDKPIELHALVETIRDILGEQRQKPAHPL